MHLHMITKDLALSKTGCRIVQKAFEVVGGADRDLLIRSLENHITQLYESPHGNHVLSRAIEVLPATRNGFVISALLGGAVTVSKHRFGCRIVCRLIEHCEEGMCSSTDFSLLLDEVLAEVGILAQHAF